MIYHGITRRQLHDLIRLDDAFAVTVAFPTARSGVDVLQGPIRLKKLLLEAESLLVRRGMRRTRALDLLRPAAELAQNVEFWNDRTDAVALFIAADRFEAVHLPMSVSEVAHVGNHFYVVPLLRLLDKPPVYYVLALDQGDVRLVRCSPSGAADVRPPGMPENVETYFALDYSEKQAQFHTTGRAGRAGTVIGHGAGDRGVEEKDRLHRFAIAIARAVESYLVDNSEPVILAGAEEFQDAFRRVARLPHLQQDGLVGSPKMLNAERLRSETAPLLEKHATQTRIKALHQFEELAGTGLTSQHIEEILPAAECGRVDSLFIQPGPAIWGTYDPSAGTVAIQPERTNSEEELANLASILTLRTAGSVYCLEVGEMKAPLAAIYRY